MKKKEIITILTLLIIGILFGFLLRTVKSKRISIKIPQTNLLFKEKKEKVSKTKETVSFSKNKPDIVEIILDASGSMKGPNSQGVLNSLVKNKKKYDECINSEKLQKIDSDRDGLPDCYEESIGTSPKNEDSDKDGKMDEEELSRLEDPLGNRPLGINSKLEEAKQALHKVIESLPEDLQVGLRIYSGNVSQKMGDSSLSGCDDVQLVVPISLVDKAKLKEKVDMMEAAGSTPLAKALELAENDFSKNDTLHQAIILVTDGIESCQGDPCSVAKRIKDNGIVDEINVIGIDIAQSIKEKVSCISDNAGGKYYNTTSVEEFEKSLKEVVGATSFKDKILEIITRIATFVPLWIYILLIALFIFFKFFYKKQISKDVISTKILQAKEKYVKENWKGQLLTVFALILSFLSHRKKEIGLILGLLIWWWLGLNWFWLILVMLLIIWYSYLARKKDKEKIKEKTRGLREYARKKAGEVGKRLVEMSERKK